MDEVYKTISRVINIDSYRKDYTYIYNYVRDTFINGLKENEHFKVLFSDLRLCGSYADNLKISKPDEFDLVMRLKFPSAELVKIVPDNSQRGNIYIYLSDVLEDLVRLKKDSMNKLLRGMINENGYLLLDKFQSWLEGCFTKFLIKIGGVLSFEGNELLLSYSKQGPAHTIDVKSKSYEFSIDFVPGFQFDRNASICPRKPTEMYWEAIPRPLYGTRNNPSFRCSFTDSERKIIAQKNHFKNVVRLMKKFRDMHPKLHSLKSYYIKTLFLWHAEGVDTNFWLQQSITNIVSVMFEKLEKALLDQNLPYFWDKDLNLIRSNLKQSQIVSMYYEVRNARKILIAPKSPEDILDFFLTKKEQMDMTTQDKQVIADNFPTVIKPALKVGGIALSVKSYIPPDEYVTVKDIEFVVWNLQMNKVSSTLKNFQKQAVRCSQYFLIVGGLQKFFLTSKQMEEAYNIIAKTINIDKDREAYTKIFDCVKKTILDGLKKNEDFISIFLYDKICGSYADKLKISKPNEFDLVMRFELPVDDEIRIVLDVTSQFGNVTIIVDNALKKLKLNATKVSLYNFLMTFVSKEGLLLENKFQNWLQSCMQKVLNEIKEKVIYNEVELRLKYKRKGPAHTIDVYCRSVTELLLSIDFVPAFVFHKRHSLARRSLEVDTWEAIPWPLKNSIEKDNYSFRTSYTDSERIILKNKGQLKNALRIMKKFRDSKPHLMKLESYYLKTIFLWLNDESDPKFWQEPLYKIIPVIFRKLEDALLNKKIRFFWDDKLNLLGLTGNQIDEMYREVVRYQELLANPPDGNFKGTILKVFLPEEKSTRTAEQSLSEELAKLKIHQ